MMLKIRIHYYLIYQIKQIDVNQYNKIIHIK